MTFRHLGLVVLTVAGLMGMTSAWAQQERKSPHETISAKTANNNRITIVYGRPYTEHPDTHERRKIWGAVVPYGKIWRLGADEATLFITEKPLELGGTLVPSGAYTLYLLPARDGSAQLIINREIGQWGLTYHQDKDLARVPMERRTLTKPVGQFTITIENGSPKGGVFKFAWEQTEYVVGFLVKS